METEIQANGKTFVAKEIKYKDIAKLGDVPKEDAAKKMMQLSTGMTDEEYDELSMKDGIAVQKVINELNGISTEDFQTPLASE